jgi:hypothetical protein
MLWIHGKGHEPNAVIRKLFLEFRQGQGNLGAGHLATGEEEACDPDLSLQIIAGDALSAAFR